MHQAKGEVQAYKHILNEGLAGAKLESRRIVGFLTAKEADSVKPSMTLLKPKEQAWTEDEIASFGLIGHTISSGWFVGVEAEWDREWWADQALEAEPEAHSPEYVYQYSLHPPNQDPTCLNLLKHGIKLRIITVAYFDHPDNWTTHEREEAESLMDFLKYIKVSRRMCVFFAQFTCYDAKHKLGTYVLRPSKQGVNGEIEMDKEGRLHKQVYCLIESSTYWNAFVSNLTITHSGFANVPHMNNDKDSFTTTGAG
ncbi:hypothetical protein JCM1841_006239 [Sporobolomyces salmonicolor]